MTPQPHGQCNPGTAVAEQVCDGCTTRPPVELFEARPFARFVVGTRVLVRYHDGWALCGTCAGLVRSRSWAALITRVANHTRDALGVSDAAIRVELADLFAHLDRHLTGHTRPIGGAA